MFFRMIYDGGLAQAAYIVGCQQTGEAVVIDPERDIDRYTRIAAENGLRIVAAAETHIHADFLSGVREFAESGVRAYLSAEGGEDWSYAWPGSRRGDGGAYDVSLLKDHDHFMVGKVRLDVVHTPGHTPEHVCFLVTDVGGGADEPMGALTGDFVFVGDVGRPDLLESAAGHAGAARPSAEALHRSAQRFGHWGEHWQVWPGHGAGSACGKALGAVPSSTVGYELRHSPAMAVRTDGPMFVDFVLADQPEPPLYFARMKRENREGPAILGSLPSPSGVEAGDLAGDASWVIVDTRPWEAFVGGHLPGSLWAPVDQRFCAVVGSYAEPGARIALVVDASALDEAIRRLVRIGLDRVGAWTTPESVRSHQRAGGEVGVIRSEDIATADPGAGATLLDVRSATEHAAGSIEGAVNIQYLQLPKQMSGIPRDRPVRVHCQTGIRSAHASAYLVRAGYDVVNLAGGYAAWARSRERVAQS